MTLIGFNSFVAFVIALVAAASVKAMNGKTSHAVRCAIVVLFVGALAQSVGFWVKQWDHYCDTILYVGILALLIANLRSPDPIPARWSGRLAIGIVVAGALVVIGYLAIDHAAAAPPTIETPYVIVPLAQDRAGGTVTLWLADVHRLIHDRAWLIDELGRMRASCGGV